MWPRSLLAIVPWSMRQEHRPWVRQSLRRPMHPSPAVSGRGGATRSSAGLGNSFRSVQAPCPVSRNGRRQALRSRLAIACLARARERGRAFLSARAHVCSGSKNQARFYFSPKRIGSYRRSPHAFMTASAYSRHGTVAQRNSTQSSAAMFETGNAAIASTPLVG
jgi:hypothetical protein